MARPQTCAICRRRPAATTDGGVLRCARCFLDVYHGRRPVRPRRTLRWLLLAGVALAGAVVVAVAGGFIL